MASIVTASGSRADLSLGAEDIGKFSCPELAFWPGKRAGELDRARFGRADHEPLPSSLGVTETS